MSSPIESDALVGGCGAAALAGLDGSADRPCRPRFDPQASPHIASIDSARDLDGVPTPSERRAKGSGADGAA